MTGIFPNSVTNFPSFILKVLLEVLEWTVVGDIPDIAVDGNLTDWTSSEGNFTLGTTCSPFAGHLFSISEAGTDDSRELTEIEPLLKAET